MFYTVALAMGTNSSALRYNDETIHTNIHIHYI